MLRALGASFDAVELTLDPITQNTVFVIKTKDQPLLIGDHGETFEALSHLVKRIAQKDALEAPLFSIDVNDYRSGRTEKLKIKAALLAGRARDTKSDVEMEPMSSYERLLVHGMLSGESSIKTESIGEGKERRIVIRYVAKP